MGAPRIDRLDKNFFINSAIEHWQRGTSVTINTASGLAALIADRFHYGSTGTTVKNYSIQRSTDIPNNQIRFSYQWSCLTAISSPAASDYVYPISVRLQGIDSRYLYQKKVTIGVWIKPSLPTATFPVQTSISINLFGSTSNKTFVKSISLSQNNIWQWVTSEVDIDSNDIFDGSLGMVVGFLISGGTNGQAPSNNTWVSGTYYYGAGNYNMMSSNGNVLRFTMPTLVLGEIKSTLDGSHLILSTRDHGEELVSCQRYYYQTNPGGDYKFSGNKYPFFYGDADASRTFSQQIWYPATMRALPVLTFSTSGTSTNIIDGSSAATNQRLDGFSAAVITSGAGGFSTGFPFIADAEL